jgi:hypothetical protein
MKVGRRLKRHYYPRYKKKQKQTKTAVAKISE